MAVTGRAIFQAHVDGLQAESVPYDIQWILASAVGQLDFVTLASGNNTITVPNTSPPPTLILIDPPNNSTAVLLLKKTTGDTGFPLSSTLGNVLTWSGGGGGTFVLNASALVTVQITYL